MNCFDSFLRVYANKHAYPKERKKSERINQMLLIKQQNHYFISCPQRSEPAKSMESMERHARKEGGQRPFNILCSLS